MPGIYRFYKLFVVLRLDIDLLCRVLWVWGIRSAPAASLEGKENLARQFRGIGRPLPAPSRPALY